MAKFGEFIVVYNILPEVAAKMLETLDQIIRKSAFDIQAAAQANITTNDQIDTGFMKNSVYVVTNKDSTYGDVGAPVKEGQELLPEVETAIIPGATHHTMPLYDPGELNRQLAAFLRQLDQADDAQLQP